MSSGFRIHGRAVLFACVFLIMAGTLSAEASYVIDRAVRLPAESYVGDRVELRYTVRTDATPEVPGETPQPRWGTVESLRVVPTAGGFDLRMTVTPYEPGTLTLPSIDLGSIRVEGLNLTVASILAPADQSLRPALGPQALPGTRGSLLGAALGFAVLVLVVFYLLGPGQRHVAALVFAHRLRLPYRRLLVRVQELEDNVARHSVREFYTILIVALQSFMTSRLGRPCEAATSREMAGVLPDLEAACGAPPGITGPLEEVLRAADGAKFAHVSVRRKKRLRHGKIVRAVAIELESHRRRARPRRQPGNAEFFHVGV